MEKAQNGIYRFTHKTRSTNCKDTKRELKENSSKLPLRRLQLTHCTLSHGVKHDEEVC